MEENLNQMDSYPDAGANEHDSNDEEKLPKEESYPTPEIAPSIDGCYNVVSYTYYYPGMNGYNYYYYQYYYVPVSWTPTYQVYSWGPTLMYQYDYAYYSVFYYTPYYYTNGTTSQMTYYSNNYYYYYYYTPYYQSSTYHTQYTQNTEVYYYLPVQYDYGNENTFYFITSPNCTTPLYLTGNGSHYSLPVPTSSYYCGNNTYYYGDSNLEVAPEMANTYEETSTVNNNQSFSCDNQCKVESSSVDHSSGVGDPGWLPINNNIPCEENAIDNEISSYNDEDGNISENTLTAEAFIESTEYSSTDTECNSCLQFGNHFYGKGIMDSQNNNTVTDELDDRLRKTSDWMVRNTESPENMDTSEIIDNRSKSESSTWEDTLDDLVLVLEEDSCEEKNSVEQSDESPKFTEPLKTTDMIPDYKPDSQAIDENHTVDTLLQAIFKLDKTNLTYIKDIIIMILNTKPDSSNTTEICVDLSTKLTSTPINMRSEESKNPTPKKVQKKKKRSKKKRQKSTSVSNGYQSDNSHDSYVVPDGTTLEASPENELSSAVSPSVCNGDGNNFPEGSSVRKNSEVLQAQTYINASNSGDDLAQSSTHIQEGNNSSESSTEEKKIVITSRKSARRRKKQKKKKTRQSGIDRNLNIDQN